MQSREDSSVSLTADAPVQGGVCPVTVSKAVHDAVLCRLANS